MEINARFKVSVVIPVYNAEAIIALLVERLVEVFPDDCALQIVLVNDGSKDGTHDVCRLLCERFLGVVQYLRLAKNFGEHSAVMAGLHHADGAFTVIMDDDFQNRPEDALRLFFKARDDGLDVVFSYSKQRGHPWARVMGSRLNGFVANLLLDKPKDLYLSSFKCISRRVVGEVLRYEGPAPYIDGLVLRCTDNLGTLEVESPARLEGSSGYTLGKLLRVWLSLFVNFSVLPLRASTFLGLVLVALAAILSGYVVFEYMTGTVLPSGWPLLFIMSMLLFGGQLLILGMIGEYIGRVLLVVNKTPQFVVRDAYGRPDAEVIPADVDDQPADHAQSPRYRTRDRETGG
jgi:glycosyltransferase involved in cell wall biosynthesis